MHPSVLTAVLLLFCTLDIGTAEVVHPNPDFLYPRYERWLCRKYPDRPCGDGWSRIDDNRCAKVIGTPKTFSEAEEHCRTLSAHLVSVHNKHDKSNLVCLNWRAPTDHIHIWVGVERSGRGFRNTDGSEFDYTAWAMGEPDNHGGNQDCAFADNILQGWWHDAHCSQMRAFACAKKM